MRIRPATLADLAALTELLNHYVENTPVTFDVRPFTPEQREPWFHEHSDGRRYRMLVADEDGVGIVGYAATGAFRNKEAYESTVEVSIALRPETTGKGIGSRLYSELFALLEQEDVHRIVAGISQPNEASNRLHERFGFRRIGTFTEVGRKFGKYWDVSWMEKELG
jgi:phosphinothricin acetyltransferase